MPDIDLIRDGTNSGMKLRVTNLTQTRRTMVATGVTDTEATLNKVINIPAGTFVGTEFVIFTGAQSVVFFKLVIGNPYTTGAMPMTEIQLLRESFDNFWEGSVKKQ